VLGKRARYSNPFRFYLTVSILFFLILSLSKNIDKFQKLTNGVSVSESAASGVFNIAIDNNELDSLRDEIDQDIQSAEMSVDSLKRTQFVDDIFKDVARDSIEISKLSDVQFMGFPINSFIRYQKKHPNMPIDAALDSIGKEKTFVNRFMFTRAKMLNSFFDNKESQEEFITQLLSYGSVALFLFLPLFTLFLKLFYIRRKYNYVHHLVFVFHVQTVFFMLLSVYFILEIATFQPKLWVFTLLFLGYLFLGMKKFYEQQYFKTFVKFILLNYTYLLLSVFGIIILTTVSFALF